MGREMSLETRQMFREKRANDKAKRRKVQTVAELQKQCDDWNAKYPPGTKVVYQTYKPDGPKHETVTDSEAWVLGEHSAVVHLAKASTYGLDFVTACEEVSHE